MDAELGPGLRDGGFMEMMSGEPPLDDAAPLFRTDSFRMYCFKVLPCSKRYCHDWTTCPFSHPSEKAKRRDPRVFSYTGVACPEMKKNMQCPRGDTCNFAHNVFEYWLHPSRYRTQLCNDGIHCRRKICFFAHTLEELRVSTVKVLPPDLAGRYGQGGARHSFDSSEPASLNPFAPDNDSRRRSFQQPPNRSLAAPQAPASLLQQQQQQAARLLSVPASPGGGSYGRLLTGGPEPAGQVSRLDLALAQRRMALQRQQQVQAEHLMHAQAAAAAAAGGGGLQQQQQPDMAPLMDRLVESLAHLQASGALDDPAVAADVVAMMLQQLSAAQAQQQSMSSQQQQLLAVQQHLASQQQQHQHQSSMSSQHSVQQQQHASPLHHSSPNAITPDTPPPSSGHRPYNQGPSSVPPPAGRAGGPGSGSLWAPTHSGVGPSYPLSSAGGSGSFYSDNNCSGEFATLQRGSAAGNGNGPSAEALHRQRQLHLLLAQTSTSSGPPMVIPVVRSTSDVGQFHSSPQPSPREVLGRRSANLPLASRTSPPTTAASPRSSSPLLSNVWGHSFFSQSSSNTSSGPSGDCGDSTDHLCGEFAIQAQSGHGSYALAGGSNGGGGGHSVSCEGFDEAAAAQAFESLLLLSHSNGGSGEYPKEVFGSGGGGAPKEQYVLKEQYNAQKDQYSALQRYNAERYGQQYANAKKEALHAPVVGAPASLVA